MVKLLKTKAEVDAALAKAGGQLVVIEYSAAGLESELETMSEEFEDVVFYKVKSQDSMTTFIFYRNSVEIRQLIGVIEMRLRESIMKHKINYNCSL